MKATPESREQLLRQFLKIPCITASSEEDQGAQFIHGHLKNLPYFQKHPQDLVLLDTRPGMGYSDGIYVIQLQGALLCKRLHFKLTGVVEVMSDNKAYATEVVSAEELGRLTVVGRVVWHGRRV